MHDKEGLIDGSLLVCQILFGETDRQCEQIRRNFTTLAKNLKVFGQFSDSLVSIWQTFLPTLAFYATEQIVIVVNG